MMRGNRVAWKGLAEELLDYSQGKRLFAEEEDRAKGGCTWVELAVDYELATGTLLPPAPRVREGHERGYLGALFMGADEFYGDALRDMRESYAAIRDGGSGIWVAGGRDLVDFMSDVVSVPVFAHPGAMAVDQNVQWGVESVEWLLHPEKTPNWDPEILLTPGYQQMIKNTHKEGNKFFTYFDPQGGQPFPEYHRRHRGMGLWKTGVDGTMTWAYIHFMTKTVRLEDPQVKNNGVNVVGKVTARGMTTHVTWRLYKMHWPGLRQLAVTLNWYRKPSAGWTIPRWMLTWTHGVGKWQPGPKRCFILTLVSKICLPVNFLVVVSCTRGSWQADFWNWRPRSQT